MITDQFQAYMAWAMTCELADLPPIAGSARASVLRTALVLEFGQVEPIPSQAMAYMARALCRADFVPDRAALMTCAFWITHGSKLELIPSTFRALVNPPPGLSFSTPFNGVTLTDAPWPAGPQYGLGRCEDHQLKLASAVVDDIVIFWPMPVNDKFFAQLLRRLGAGSTITLVYPGAAHAWWASVMGLFDVFSTLLNYLFASFVLVDVAKDKSPNICTHILGVESRRAKGHVNLTG